MRATGLKKSNGRIVSVKALYFLGAFLVSFPAASISGEGADGFQFLREGWGARQVAMAETGVSFSDDVNAVFYNPAALGYLEGREASLLYVSHLQGVSMGGASYAHPLRKGSLFGSVQSLSSGNIESFDTGNQRIADFEIKDQAFTLGYGRRFKRSFSGGLLIKQVSESIADVSAQTYAADAGVSWESSLFDDRLPLKWGAAARNMGSGAEFLKETTELPQTVDFGVSSRGWSRSVAGALEYHKPRGDKGYINGGVEFWMQNRLALRAGFSTDRDLARGLTFGMGFKLKNIQMDYSFSGYENDFGDIHHFSFIFRFGGTSEKLYREGVALAQAGRHAEAILKFQKALESNPDLTAAVKGLRESVEILRKEMALP